MERYTDEELDRMYKEETSKNRRSLLLILTAIAICGGGQLAAAVVYVFSENLIVTAVIFAVTMAITVLYCVKSFGNNMFRYTDILHRLLIPYCVQDMFGEDAVYSKKEGIPLTWIRDSHLLGEEWTDYYGSALVKGSYQGISFMQSDVCLIRHTESEDSEGNTNSYDTTVFEGVWAVLDFPKSFSTNLVVREREGRHSEKWEKNKSVVQMENIAFNEKFTVIAEDAHNAFYLLTPHMMEHIIETEKRFAGRIYFCFMDGKLHIAIDNGKTSFGNIMMINGAANERKRICQRLSLVPELIKQMKL